MNTFFAKTKSLLFSGSTLLALTLPVGAGAQSLPDATSEDFCVAIQHLLANTEVAATNTVFDNMPDYRASKPAPDPLMIYQVLTYDGDLPITVSCKVKTADHIRATYGEAAAGEQQYCPVATQILITQAANELEQEGLAEAAATARTYVADQNEPYMMGSQYLSDFEISYTGDDGLVHLQAPGLQTNWEDWLIWIMPNRLRGQTYCHLPTVKYIKALASGELQPGTVVTTTDGTQTTPSSAQ